MGVDKAGLRLGGKTLLGHIRATAKEAGLPVRVLRRDLVARCGPLGGIYTALQTTRAESVLFLSCDMPFVTSRLLREMCLRLTPDTPGVFLEQDGFGFPFLVRRDALGLVRERLQAQQLSLQSFARRLKAVPLPLPPGPTHALLNINTREDFQRACALLNANKNESGSKKRRPRGRTPSPPGHATRSEA